MDDLNASQREALQERIRHQAAVENIRITQHAHQEMVEEGVSLEEVLHALTVGQILEYYPDHRRGPCCLLNGLTLKGRPLHIVCTTNQPMLVIITVYEPRPPKWVTPTQRRGSK